ncbi:hypothetical protein CEXT_271481 [Caerostris extrusa]|uniref:Uncharacterized protein n=1 Tax=Caerostris extrusa TaxID=172846 RepID=A0AAV4SX98_CAEEX|nr:hypothetical protein CEXT_271481 [Caerostris extrusa]
MYRLPMLMPEEPYRMDGRISRMNIFIVDPHFYPNQELNMMASNLEFDQSKPKERKCSIQQNVSLLGAYWLVDPFEIICHCEADGKSLASTIAKLMDILRMRAVEGLNDFSSTIALMVYNKPSNRVIFMIMRLIHPTQSVAF